MKYAIFAVAMAAGIAGSALAGDMNKDMEKPMCMDDKGMMMECMMDEKMDMKKPCDHDMKSKDMMMDKM